MRRPESPMTTFPPRQPRPRRLKTRSSVLAAEVISRIVITIGGLFTIAAVLTVFGFLLFKVVPLFKSAEIGPEHDIQVQESSPLLRFNVDEYQKTAAGLFANGNAVLNSLDDGSTL